MAKKATTLHDNLGNDLLPVTNASITYMDNGNSVQAEINDLKEKTQYNKGHYTTEQDLLTAYPNGIQNPQLRKGWYAIVGSTDTVWIWDIEGNEWKDSGVSSGGVDSVNGLDGEVILTGGNINATATINDTSKTELINKHLTDIYSELDNKVDLDNPQVITGAKTFQTNTDYDLEPAELIKLNNNFQGNTRELNLGTVFNEELELISKYKDSGTNPIYRASLNLAEKGLFFTEYKEGETPDSLDGIITNDGKVYSVGIVNGEMTQDELAKVKNTVDLNSSQTITGTKVFTEVIGLANTSEGTVDQIKHINSNFLITSGTGQNLLNIDEGLQTISAFNRELAYEDEIAEIQGNYVTNDTLAQEIQNITDMIPTDNSELTNGANYATEQYVQQNGGKIDTISVNGVQQDIINKNVNISVPTDYVTNQQLTDGLNSKQNNLTSAQLQAVNSGATSTNINQITTNSNSINDINSKIPNQASSTNQLTDKDFVNSSLNSITAFYITSNSDGDPFPTKSSLLNATTYYSGGQVRIPTRNDYAIVLEDESEGNATTRYIYYNQWEYQYTVNETALTASQLSAINSGITSTLVNKITTNETMINSLAEQVVNDYVPNTRTINGKPLNSNVNLSASDVGLGNVDNTSDANKPISNATQTALNNKVDKTTKINNKPLSSDITLNANDVGALSSDTPVITYGETISPNADEYNVSLISVLLDNEGNEKGALVLSADASIETMGLSGTYMKLVNASTGESLQITSEAKIIVDENEVELPKGKSGTIALTSDIPNSISDLTQDSTHRTVTDSQISSWDSKATTSYVDTKTNDLNDLLNQKQNTITSSNKLSNTLISGLGTASTLNTGTSSGNVPVLGSDGKLPSSVVPASAITDTFVVNSSSAQLALTAQVGDVCVRTDLNKSYILKAEPASNVNNWQELLTPTDAVQTVNGLTGNVVLDATSVGAVPNNTAFYVKSVNGKTGDVTGLATNDVATTSKAGLMSISDKTKLNGIASGAEANVQSDWNEASSTSDAYIKNKPSVPAKYDATKTYKSGDMVLYVNRIFEYRYSTPSAGNAPPTAEAEQSNTYWISTNAYKAYIATKATLDGSGNVITSTYATKSQLGTQATFSLSGTTLTITPK